MFGWIIKRNAIRKCLCPLDLAPGACQYLCEPPCCMGGIRWVWGVVCTGVVQDCGGVRKGAGVRLSVAGTGVSGAGVALVVGQGVATGRVCCSN